MHTVLLISLRVNTTGPPSEGAEGPFPYLRECSSVRQCLEYTDDYVDETCAAHKSLTFNSEI